MNKLFAIAFMCIYLLLTVGVVKTTHYCMGREKSTKIFAFDVEKCCCGPFFADSGCCSDITEIVKIDDFQSLSASLLAPIPDFALIYTLFYDYIESDIIAKTSLYAFFDDIPIPQKRPIFKLNCSLVFYDDDLIG